MAKVNIEAAQNVEISKKIPCEKPLQEQLEIMERYTAVHREHLDASKEMREAACLEVLYPTLFRHIEEGDLIAGRLDFLPIGFGCVTSVGGVGHYCVFRKLKQFREQLPEADRPRVDALYHYWEDHDLKTAYNKETLQENILGTFIETAYPMIATARLSGMMLDYPTLLEGGIGGLRQRIEARLAEDPQNQFLLAGLRCLNLFVSCARHLKNQVLMQKEGASAQRKEELDRMAESLEYIQDKAPETFHQALQLFWLYALLAGVINYGRLDDFLGPFLARDLEAGRITEDQAYKYVRCLWTLIENRRTTVNGRIIVGGRGRKHPKEADLFLHLCMRVAKDCRYVEPQFTLRLDKDTSEQVWNEALDALGAGATYPTIYNDDIEIPAVAYGMRVDEKTAEQYVPFGCTEFVIQGESTGTPNICINLLKILNIFMNGGVDPQDGIRKDGGVPIKPLKGYNPDKQYNVRYFSSDSPGDILAMLEVLTGGHFSSCNSF